MPKQTISFQIFERLSSTNFTWSILEYLDPFLTLTETEKLMADKQTYLIIFHKNSEIKQK